MMLSLAKDGEIALWDAQKLSVLQIVRNKQYMIANTINSHSFCKLTGTMLMATTKVFKWKLEECLESRVMSEQQHAVARDFLI